MADNGTYKIEKGIKEPERYVWPLPKMDIGDSFLIGPSAADAQRVSVACQYFKKKQNMAFSIRKTPDGYRCWRIA